MSDFFSSGWSVFVAAATVLGLVACVVLLVIASRRQPSAADNTTGHVWDEDLRELNNPRDVVPESNMPAYPWLVSAPVDAAGMPARLSAMRTLGVPYTEEEVKASTQDVAGKTELDALVAYLQVLGTANK